MVPGWLGPTAHAGLVIAVGPVRGLACNGGGALGQAGLEAGWRAASANKKEGETYP